MKSTGIPNLYEEGNSLYTLTKFEKPVYGERILIRNSKMYREFSPLRSKLASSIKLGFKPELGEEDHMLYLGASTGTTASHISDILSKGVIFAVEFSPVSMIKLSELGKSRENLIPLLLDANKPEQYEPFIDWVDMIYQDIAQPNQIDIFLKNVKYYSPKRGIIMYKSYSMRSNTELKNEINKLKKYFKNISMKNIERFHKGHYAIYVSNH